jgi:hypothetical protein
VAAKRAVIKDVSAYLLEFICSTVESPTPCIGGGLEKVS